MYAEELAMTLPTTEHRTTTVKVADLLADSDIQREAGPSCPLSDAPTGPFRAEVIASSDRPEARSRRIS